MLDSSPSHRQRLDQVQRQTLRLSPLQLRFSRMLEMSEPEVEEEVAAALEENPALEASDPAPTPVNDKEGEQQLLLSASNYSPDDEKWERQPEADIPTLAEALEAQLDEYMLSESDREIALIIIGNLDENGYLTRKPALIASDMNVQGREDVEVRDVERMLHLIQSLDPAGVGAADLRECLLLQIRRHNPLTTSNAMHDAQLILDNHYDKLSRMQLDKLAQATDFDSLRLKEALEAIRTLNPKPGASFIPASRVETANVIIPDFIVESEGNRFVVTIPSRVPALNLSESFDIDASTATTLKEREAALVAAPYREEALTLIKALEMRHTTMLRVMQAIVSLQSDFFKSEEVSDLRPMLLKDVAAVTGYDLSTVSRATNGKYVATEGGVYPMKMFFNDRTNDDTDATAHEVMEVIKAIISDEDSHKPLSDDAIAEMLDECGFSVARRTVAKYRERLSIPTSRLRRKI